ncbi:MAG: hypothetical protein N2438_11765 [Limisphaera sp.]|nr:hypothetical protein [Limisphaera sp.]
MTPEPDARLEAAVRRALEGLRPVPAPPTLVGRVMAALPETRPVAAVRGWPAWPVWIRWPALAGLAGAATTAGWALTLYVLQPAAAQLGATLKPLWAAGRAVLVMAEAMLTQAQSLPPLWWYSAVALAGLAVALTALLGSCYVRLLQFTTPMEKGISA